MSIEVITFNEAISRSERYNKRHLLIGNGFSIACIPSIFTYQSIFNEADFDDFPEVRKAFELLKTMDFEHVIHSLNISSKVVKAYDENNEELPEKLVSHAEELKKILISTIAENHPGIPSEVSDNKFKSCRKFLANFVSDERTGRIYSLNYDLLLYWTLMHEFEDEEFILVHDDGFRNEVDEHFQVLSDELTWQGKQDHQNIYYIHGALHLFQGLGEIEKFSWTGTGVPLIDQARKALASDKYPMFVSEGDSQKKFSRIMHNPYLYNCYNSFEAVANGGRSPRVGNTCMFVHGLSFSDNDKHILDCISNGKLKHIFVGIFGDPDNETNKSIILQCEAIKSSRGDFPLSVTYYDSESAAVWDD